MSCWLLFEGEGKTLHSRWSGRHRSDIGDSSQWKPARYCDLDVSVLKGPTRSWASEVPRTTLSTEVTGLVTQPRIRTASPLAREDNEVQKELITHVAEQAEVAKVSELFPHLVTLHMKEV